MVVRFAAHVEADPRLIHRLSERTHVGDVHPNTRLLEDGHHVQGRRPVPQRRPMPRGGTGARALPHSPRRQRLPGRVAR